MRHLIFDTETTQLISNSLQPIHKQPRIIEFYGLVLDDAYDWREVGELGSFIDPGIPITEEITKITGIKQENLRNAPTFATFATRLSILLESSDVAVAHNFSYDRDVVDFEYRRIGKGDLWAPWPGHSCCTVESTEHLKGFRLSLTNLHTELFGEPFTGAHRAETDVRALAKCYVELHKRGIL